MRRNTEKMREEKKFALNSMSLVVKDRLQYDLAYRLPRIWFLNCSNCFYLPSLQLGGGGGDSTLRELLHKSVSPTSVLELLNNLWGLGTE